MSNKQLVENQLLLHIGVGPAGGRCAERHTAGYNRLARLLDQSGLTLFGVADPSGDFVYLAVELCECEWDCREEQGRATYSVCFRSTRPIDQPMAVKLRDLVLEAYTPVCGGHAQFIRADLVQKWEESTTSPFEI